MAGKSRYSLAMLANQYGKIPHRPTCTQGAGSDPDRYSILYTHYDTIRYSSLFHLTDTIRYFTNTIRISGQNIISASNVSASVKHIGLTAPSELFCLNFFASI